LLEFVRVVEVEEMLVMVVKRKGHVRKKRGRREKRFFVIFWIFCEIMISS
jgi:uncharacterized protein YceH (UPF0502 family)